MSFSGFVLLCCLGIAAAGEQPLPPPSPHHHDHRQEVAHVTTVCIQMHGQQSGPLCGPMVPPPDEHPGTGSRSSDGAAPSAKAGEPYRYEVPRPMHQRMVPENAVFQDYYQGVPVYQLLPARASSNQPSSAGLKSAVPPPCADAAQQNSLFNQPPQMRTFPFAPFGIQDTSAQSRMAQQHPLTSSGMRMAQQHPMTSSDMRMAQLARQAQAMPPPQSYQQSQHLARMMPESQGPSYSGLLPPSEIYGGTVQLMRAASECPDGQQPQQQQRAVIKGVPPQVFRTSNQPDPQSIEEWKRQCEEKEKEIRKKTEEINDLKKQLERMAAVAAEKSVTAKATTPSAKSTSSKEQPDDNGSADAKKEEKPQTPAQKKRRSAKA